MKDREKIKQAEVMVKAAGREPTAQNLLSTTLTYFPELRYTVGMPEILDYLSPPKQVKVAKKAAKKGAK